MTTTSSQERGPAIVWPLGPIAHRGLHDPAAGRIENTASAVLAAISKGYAIEVDLQQTLEHQPVVFHDETLDRLIEAQGPVQDRNVPDLQRLAFKNSSDRILTFDQLLDIVGGQVPLFVEIKTRFGAPGRYEQNIADRITHYDGPLALMSFDPGALAVMRELAPQIPRGILSYNWDDGWMPMFSASKRQGLANLSQADQLAPSFIAYDIDDLPAAAPAELKQRLAIPLLAWTVRTPEQRERAARLADAIIFEGFEP